MSNLTIFYSLQSVWSLLLIGLNIWSGITEGFIDNQDMFGLDK